MPKISVIMPVYNVEKYLRECLDSVQKSVFVSLVLQKIEDSEDAEG